MSCSRPGTFVFTSFTGANLDPAVFGTPRTLRHHRARPPPPPAHLRRSGIHYCLGASLARAELQEALPILARRLPGLALDGPVVWKPETVGIWGPMRLPLRFEPGH